MSVAAIDCDRLREVVGEDAELLRELVEIYRDEVPRLKLRMSAALSRNDLGELEKAAHRLKGSLAAVGARCYPIAQELESYARSGAVKAAEYAYFRLQQELDAVLPELENLVQKGDL